MAREVDEARSRQECATHTTLVAMKNHLLVTCALAGFSGFAQAQSTFVVGPGGFPQISDALAVAAPGDVIQVEPGAYGIFFANFGVTIRAVTPGTVSIAGFIGSFVFTPPGQHTHLVGLDFSIVNAHSANVTFDQCTMNGYSPLLVTDSTVHMQDCEVTTDGSQFLSNAGALRAEGSYVTAVDSTFASVSEFATSVRLTNSTLQGSHLTLHAPLSAVALTANANSVVWLSDSVVTSDPAGCAIMATTGRTARCTLSPDCGSLGSGPLLGVTRPQPLQPGAVFTLDFQTEPLQFVAVFSGLSLHRYELADVEQPVLLDSAGSFISANVLADASGQAVSTWLVPSSPSLLDRSFWFQAVSGASLPLQASPVVGGVIR